MVSVPTYENVACPITGRPATRTIFVDTDYGRVYVCSRQCVAKVQADPIEAYRKAYPVTQQAKNQVDPVTGEDIGYDPVTVILQGREFSVRSQESVAKAKANAQIVLAKINRPDTKDVGNAIDPISGKPVVDNAFCIVGHELIHLSDPALVDEVRKDPAKALATAKDLVAKAAAAAKAPPPKPDPKPKGGKK